MSRRTVLPRLVHRVIAAPAPALDHCARRMQTLAFEEIKDSLEKPHQYTALILHGLLGSGRNWRSFSRSLAASLSPAQQLWVLDSVPGQVSQENSDGEVEKVLRTLQSLPSTVPSRKWLVDHMLQLGFSNSLSQWIRSNLKTSGKEVTWAFNLEGAVQMFYSYGEMDYWPLLEYTPKGMEIAIVRAEKSDRWNADVIKPLNDISSKRVDEIKGKVSIHVLPNAGHWVHVDNAKGLLEIIAPKVASLV